MNIEIKTTRGNPRYRSVTIHEDNTSIEGGLLDNDEQKDMRIMLIHAACELCDNDEFNDKLSDLLNKYAK